jgi:hypothetical protein
MRLSLAARTLAIVVVAIVPLLGVIVYNELALRGSREAEVRAIALRTAEQTALELDRLRSGAEALLGAIAAAPVVGSNDRAGCEQFLSRVIERLPQYLSLAVLDADGSIRCRNDGQKPDLNFADRPYFKDALAQPLKLVIADYTVSRVTGAATLPISLAFGGDRPGVAVASLNLDWLQRVVENRPIPEDGSVTVADRNGVILARAPLPDRFVGTTVPDDFMLLVHESAAGSVELTSQDGTRRYLGYVPVNLPPLGLYVSLGVGKEAAFADINAATLRTVLMTAIACGGDVSRRPACQVLSHQTDQADRASYQRPSPWRLERAKRPGRWL